MKGVDSVWASRHQIKREREHTCVLNELAWCSSRSPLDAAYSCEAVFAFVLAKSSQSCLTLCNPMDCIPPGSSVHGIIQARTLEWVVIFSSRGSS